MQGPEKPSAPGQARRGVAERSGGTRRAGAPEGSYERGGERPRGDGPRRFTIDVRGPLHGMEYGGQGRMVLLAHGLSGSGVNWEGVGASLTAYGRVLAPEMPGFGRTPPAGRRCSIGAHAELMADLIERDCSGPALVVGNSMGAVSAMLLAGHRPELVDRLVLIDTPAPSPTLRGMTPVWITTMVLYLVPGLNKGLLQWFGRQGTPEQLTEAGIDLLSGQSGRISRSTVRTHARVTAERMSMPWGYDAHLEAYRSLIRRLVPYTRFDRMVRRVQAPTLLIHGTKDPLVPARAAERLASIRPDWTYRPLVGFGHIGMMECPELVLELISEFMTGGAGITATARERAAGSSVAALPRPGQETSERPGVDDRVPPDPAPLRLADSPSRLIQFPGPVRVGGDREAHPAASGPE